jgi:hypothetical protein
MTAKRISIAVGALLAAALLGYGFGRYALPAEVVTKTVVDVQTKVEWKDRVVEKIVQGPTRTVTHVVERPVACVPGETTPSVETTTTVDAGPIIIDRVADETGTEATVAHAATTTTIIREQPRLMLQGGIDLKRVWDASASYRVMGPGWLGLAYRNDVTVKPLDRLNLRLTFTF